MHASPAVLCGLKRICARSLILVVSLFACVLILLTTVSNLYAQSSATISGTVTDQKGAVIVEASVTAINEATQDIREVKSNKDGLFAFPTLLPSTYSIKVVSQGFAPKELTGIDLHGGDDVKLPSIVLAIGAVTETVTVETASQIMETANGQRSELLSYRDIQDLALEGRDITELLKILPGVTTQTSGGVVAYNPQSVTTGQSAIGQGMTANGAANRGGTTLMMDGVSILDPGADFSSLATVNPEMTQEVNVLSTNFGADSAFGPVVVNAASRSGGAKFHGAAYLNTRNDIFNANDWVDNHSAHAKAGAAYYYPGGSISGPVPGTHKKLFFFGGTELLYQNQGSLNTLKGYVPTPEMLQGDFSLDNPDNIALCTSPTTGVAGFYNTNQSSVTTPGWCNNIANTPTFPSGTAVSNPYYTIFADGTSATPSSMANPSQTQTAGGKIPAQYINQNMLALASLWPKPTATTLAQIQSNGGYNYYQPIVNHDNGWIYRARIDYDWNENNKFYIAYQQGYDRQLANGAGTNIYSTGTLQFPGGGLYKTTYSKVISGHYVHTFNSTTTNEAIASWVYGSIPTAPPNPSADYRSTIGFNVPTVYGGASKYAPTYSGATYGFPGITQADIFEPGGFYTVEKTTPTFADNFTKVWGDHTLKFGAFASNTDNFQGNMGTNLQGSLTVTTGLATNYFASIGQGGTTTNNYTGLVGSYNPTVAFLMGNLSNYAESNSSPLQDLAFQTVAFYANDEVKVSKKLTVQVGLRFEHIGHWYDRQGTGIAVFYPQRVLPDFYSGKVNPGFYWHGIDGGIPLSGAPNRLGFLSPRFGLSYDVFSTGKTLLRGGWGAYRFAEQYNDASNALGTAQAVKQFSASTTTSGHNFLLSQLDGLVPANCQVQCPTTSTQYGFDSTDYGIPLTYSYNFTIDQRLPWTMLLDVAYVGNTASRLSDTGASLTSGGQLNESFANQNKVPLGAFFKPDPLTSVFSCNPENLSGPCSPQNTSADYYPYGKTNTGLTIYGTNSLYQSEHIAYANYNGLQVALVKRAGPVTLNVNWTYSKSLGTVNNNSPFNYRLDYGYDLAQRPFVFNSSYVYREGNAFHGDRFIRGAVNGWTVSGISTWQEGSNTAPGVNFQYDPATLGTAPAQTQVGVGANTYYGTNAGIAIRPVLTCNPRANLAFHQVYQPCFAPPAPGASFGVQGANGGLNYPYVPGPAFLENDLAIYKSFTIHEQNKVQLRVSAFNWLNHPLPNFGPQDQTTEYYYINYQTKAVYPNTAATNSVSNPTPYLPGFGFMSYKNAAGANSQRIMELDLKYTF